MTNDSVTYEEWIAELKLVAVEKYEWTNTSDFDQDCWRISYDDGMTPEEALLFDLSYA